MSATCTYYVGDALTVLRTLPDASADLVLSSPPFMALRAYLPPDHPDKAKEMGSEPTPGEFLDALLDVVEELDRVLAPHGTLAFELGDTYAGSGGAGGDYAAGGMRDGQPVFRQATNGRRNRPADEAAGILTPRSRPGPEGRDRVAGFPLDKSLCLIPELFRFALAYGLNPLTGRQTPRWRVRNVVRWCRPNPPVGALGDKFRPATSDLVVACKSRTRYFDLDAVRVPFTGHAGVGTGKRKGQNGAKPEDNRPGDMPTRVNTHDGAPPLDWWAIPTKGYPGSHYATWPPALLTRPILAMCPERVCTVCGEPSRRIVDAQRIAEADDSQRKVAAGTYRLNGHDHPPEVGWEFDRTTTGWTDCGHGSWRPGLVLDCFAGTGTTLAVAQGHGRSAIGIDLDERNADLARARVGMFLEVVAEAPS